MVRLFLYFKKQGLKGRDVHRMCAVMHVLKLLTAEINGSYPIPFAPSMTQRNTKFFLTDLYCCVTYRFGQEYFTSWTLSVAHCLQIKLLRRCFGHPCFQTIPKFSISRQCSVHSKNLSLPVSLQMWFTSEENGRDINIMMKRNMIY